VAEVWPLLSSIGRVRLLADVDWGWWLTHPLSITLLVLLLFVGVCWLAPGVLLRPFLWLITHSIYWLRVLGRNKVPRRGGALLVCNHVSYIDWLLLLAAQPRFIRFVIFAGWANRFGLRHLLKWAGVIPIDGSSGPRAIIKSLRQASDALARGELVCIFAEGRFTRNGFMLPFNRGFEQILKHCPAPIIPVSLDQVWGSIFSLYGGKAVWKWPLEIPYHANVTFGDPLPADTRAADVRQAVQKLSADCAVARTQKRLPVHRRFVRAAKRFFSRPCLLDGAGAGTELNYGKALVGAMCLAQVLRPRLGDKPMVAIWVPPSVGGALANIAVALLGKTSVNLNYTSSLDVVHAALRQTDCGFILTSKQFTARVKIEPPESMEVLYLEDLRTAISKKQQTRAYLAARLLPTWILEHWVLGLGRHKIESLATVIFSSGSTGEPKGVMLTQGNIAANIESVVQGTGVSVRDRMLAVLPFFHSFGYTVTLWAPLQVGASVVYHPDPRAAREIGELCKTRQCTIYLSTATFLRFCLRKCEPDSFRSVRILMCGAEKLPPTLAEEFMKKFQVLPLEGYGCTELSPVAAANLPDVEVEGYKQIGNKTGTVGQPLPGIAARVVDAETMKPLPVGEEGLLLIHGANVMKGYLKNPEQTASVVLDGWYVTGDMARIDPDGFVTLTGRLSRFAKIGGEMVPLDRVQDELHEALGTGDRIGAVTCVPDEARGERLIVLYLADALHHHGVDVHGWAEKLAGRGLPNLWRPAERDYHAVPELPVLGSGKLDLKKLKDLALEKAAAGRSAPAPHAATSAAQAPTT
jgi:acyl-[acyl-carrier-protein]-phospholipid O-acyltransferase/long-chain-fatty-acid--[acyl-carrier-protein] ligase